MENKATEIAVSSVTVNGQVDDTHEAKQQSEDTAHTSSLDASTKPAHDGPAQLSEAEAVKPDVESTKGSAQPSRETSTERKPFSASPSGATSSYVPPVKRFSAVNINKKFLEKNQSAGGASGSHPTASTSGRQTGPVARPAPQSSLSHSRLVTTKLTAAPLSTSPGPGWSRPTSATPPASSPASAPTPAGNKPTTPAVGHGPPQLPPAGKVIQPQARNVLKSKVDNSSALGKPAWQSIQLGGLASGLGSSNEFPTAAEAAQGLQAKHADMKAAAEAVEAQKQALLETADAFRGVHLDPNAHHWDDMEEDDNDDFLGGVIDFGDGRQYTIQVNDQSKPDATIKGDAENRTAVPDAPVSKEERFADDFDRSWPRSRHEQGAPHDIHTGPRHEGPRSRSSFSDTASNFSAHSPVSTRDHAQSRVLFNERSNRMEPYSSLNRPGFNGQHGNHQVPFKRNGDSSAHSHRLERDAPPHTLGTNVQVLQKPHREHSRGPPESGRDVDVLESVSVASQSSDGYDRLKSHRDRLGSNQSSVPPIGDERRNGQPWAKRVPSVFPGAHSGHRDLDRQPPPHLNQHQPPAHSTDVRAPSEHNVRSESRVEKTVDVSQDSQQTTQHEPVHSSQTVPSESGDSEAIQKAYLAESVERAKRRRQQEEEERAKAQDRARKKAAELAAKAEDEKRTEEDKIDSIDIDSKSQLSSGVPDVRQSSFVKPSEAEVLNVIEDAVRLAAQPDGALKGDSTVDVSSSKPWGRAPSSRGSDRPSMGPRRPPVAPLADQANSWRTKARPPVLPVQNSGNDLSKDPLLATPAPAAFEPLDIEESMEVVDFEDLGRLVGGGKQPQMQSEDSTLSLKPSRSVASDFFDAPKDKVEPDTWRRAAPASTVKSTPESSTLPKDTSDAARNTVPHARFPRNHDREFEETPQTPPKPSSSNDTSSTTSHLPQNQQMYPPPSPGLPRLLRNQGQYREAPLSALDDTMSRIKGALDGMHASSTNSGKPVSSGAVAEAESSKHQSPLPVSTSTSQSSQMPSLAPKREKWLPPALRPPGVQQGGSRLEPFELTRPEPPRSPAPPDGKAIVSLPKTSQRRGPLPRQQAEFAKKAYAGPVRWDILSFDPPPEGMNKRNLSMVDVLFRKTQFKKIRVSFPKPKGVNRHPAPANSQFAARVNLPPGNQSTPGAFGKPSKANQSSWRSTNARTEINVNVSQPSSGLDVTSRSPPPDLNVMRLPDQPIAAATEVSHSRTSSRSKVSSRLLQVDGSDVVFYKDMRVQSASIKNTIGHVSFTVSSELEGDHDQAQVNIPDAKSSKEEDSASGRKEETVVSLSLPGQVQPVTASEAKSSAVTADSSRLEAKTMEKERETDPLLRSHPATPPSQSSSAAWVRSPARVDPEHLKAVWSQTPAKDGLPTVNSLKGIADDLSTVPFSIHEVKSEDGGTPPLPGPVPPPSRMSASEVTRAFQTVPSGPSNPTLRANPFSPMMGSPLNSHKALKPPIGHPQPPVDPNASRSPYMTYPPQLNGHSPSPPTLVYSHVSPATTPYAQPMWMSLPQQGPQMMRPQPSSPYNSSLMPYSMPTGQNGMYHSPNPVPQPQPPQYNRPMGSQLLVSPVMTQASPVPHHMVYTTSPMLIHPPPGPVHQPQPYAGAIGMGRGSMPPPPPPAARSPMDQRHPPNPMSQPPAAPTPRFPTHNPGYSHVPPQSFIRPSW